MRLYKRGRVWWTWLTDEDGKQKCVSTKCHDRSAAEKVARSLERIAADPVSAAAHQTTVVDALDALVADRRERAKAGKGAEATANFYEAKAGHVARLLNMSLAHLRAKDIDGYITARRNETASDSTISKELVTLRAALKIAVRHELWSGNPAAILPIGFSPEYKPKRRFLSEAEMQKLLAQLLPDRAARVAFIVATSANWSESERARKSDVTLSDGVADLVHLRGTKRSSRDRVVPVTLPSQRFYLRFALQHADGKNGTLFAKWQNVRRDLHVACDNVEPDKLPHCSPNDLRRTYAQWLRAAGITTDLIAATMGHVDSRMVERVYGKLPTDVLQARLVEQCSNSVVDGRRSGRQSRRSKRPSKPKNTENKEESGARGRNRTADTRIFSPESFSITPRFHRKNGYGDRQL